MALVTRADKDHTTVYGGNRETKSVMLYYTSRAIVSLRRDHFHRSTEHVRLCEIQKLIGWIDLVFLGLDYTVEGPLLWLARTSLRARRVGPRGHQC